MNYSWNWGVLLQSTGVGDSTYLDWILTGIGWLFVIAIVAWSIAMVLGSILCEPYQAQLHVQSAQPM